MIRAVAESMNRQMAYMVDVDTVDHAVARRVLRDLVIADVKQQYGQTPAGIPYLVDPRTIETKDR